MGLGKKLGFPTFNIKVDPLPELPFGVYAVRAEVNGVAYNALMHFGPKPSVHMIDIFCEVFVLHFLEEQEVKSLGVEVLGKLREVMKFDSPEQMVVQIRRDQELATSTYFTV